MVRVWGNDAADASVKRYAIRPSHTNNGLLSLTSATASPLAKVKLPPQPQPQSATLDPKWPTRALKADQIAASIPEAAVIIVDLKGLSQRNGIGITLMRMGQDKDALPSASDHAPDQVNLFVGLLGAKREGNFLAVAVPPGRWRIAAMGLAPQLGFCLGAPSFEVRAGEVVYAGAFDLGGPDLGPDLSLDTPKAWLAGQPAAAKIQPAVYTNGAEGLCGYNGIYALEVKGAPYEPGYHWGGAQSISGSASESRRNRPITTLGESNHRSTEPTAVGPMSQPNSEANVASQPMPVSAKKRDFVPAASVPAPTSPPPAPRCGAIRQPNGAIKLVPC